ncbi:hypothetical protein B0I35DRAFT_481967 [Stachybotrys elegans]|uniref:Uncharacterized protein n=1 Tax=Stachybotrys elegans TaxID=80388 RepID=A0A8K0WML1_9HYPO|nr:hypothetical protein B0I35DRAFT_481967 [Stachybotrys elegans]
MMLTIAQASGLIAAGVMVVQYLLPTALVIVLVKLVGTENTAASWSTVNRTISNTIWPLLLGADSTGTRNRSNGVVAVAWTMTIGAALIVIAGIAAPLGLRDEVSPSAAEPVYFEYARDPTAWGRSTQVRPNARFGRYCEFGRRINCPGQYQGVDFVETSPGNFESVQNSNSSTVNTTIPSNFTTIFSSATSDPGNTLSGLFDIQYRRWTAGSVAIIDRGQPRVRGDFRYMETLIPHETIQLKEGLIVDTRNNPGIGFRNHTVPLNLDHGGTWSEDLTWLEPVTSCADTNLTVEIETVDTESFLDNSTVFLVDRGAFRGLDLTALETRPWGDNQTLDLAGRAHKAARMYNVLIADTLNISLPLSPPSRTLRRINVEDAGLDSNLQFFGTIDTELISISSIAGIQGATDDEPSIRVPRSFRSQDEEGRRMMFVSNFTAIAQVCSGYYGVEDSIDWRAANISNPAVHCGLILGASPIEGDDGTLTLTNRVTIKRKNIYICASAIRAGVKTVDFRYNGTSGHLANLRVERIQDKVYPSNDSRPLWAVEQSWPQRMTFDPLWGMVDDSYENAEGLSTMRSEKLWVPAGVAHTTAFGTAAGSDSLAGNVAPGLTIANVYMGTSAFNLYSSDMSFSQVERFSRLSANETSVSQIPELIATDTLASLLVGTKTAIRTAPVEYPASLMVNDAPTGLSRANIVVYRRVVRYDLRYAIPGLILLGLLAAVLAVAGD